MKLLINRVLGFLVRRLYRVSALRKVKAFIMSVLLEGSIPLSSVVHNRRFGKFSDSRGHTYELVEGLRDAVKPGWRWIFHSDEKRQVPPQNELRTRIQWAGEAVSRVLYFLEASGFYIKGKNVLEFGCDDGIKCYSFLSQGARLVVGTDVSEQMPLSRDEESINKADSQPRQYYHQLHEAYQRLLGQRYGKEKLRFCHDDITSSSFESELFDLVCSWEVLEHVQAPQKMFEEIHRLLRPGGITFHEYNPFFSINGGHSFCTLDFPWGHAVLSPDDFKRYLQEFRPEETEMSYDFFMKQLNRMTLHDLRESITDSGLELLTIIPFPDMQHLSLLNGQTLSAASSRYPSLNIVDLISPTIWVVCRKVS